MFTTSEKVTAYIDKKGEGWKGEILYQLRDVMKNCEVEEGVKWGVPTYMNNGNVASMAAFKNHVALWFHHGVFLSDHENVLTTSDGTSEYMRQWRFQEGDKVDTELVKAYMDEAVENSKAGKKGKAKPQNEEEPIQPAFVEALKNSPKAKRTFDNFSLAKRNEYIRHIAAAKREETQLKRIEKSIGYLEQGLDLNHKYRK